VDDVAGARGPCERGSTVSGRDRKRLTIGKPRRCRDHEHGFPALFTACQCRSHSPTPQAPCNWYIKSFLLNLPFAQVLLNPMVSE
jgi:hypothetical protein